MGNEDVTKAKAGIAGSIEVSEVKRQVKTGTKRERRAAKAGDVVAFVEIMEKIA